MRKNKLKNNYSEKTKYIKGRKRKIQKKGKNTKLGKIRLILWPLEEWKQRKRIKRKSEKNVKHEKEKKTNLNTKEKNVWNYERKKVMRANIVKNKGEKNIQNRARKKEI